MSASGVVLVRFLSERFDASRNLWVARALFSDGVERDGWGREIFGIVNWRWVGLSPWNGG